MDTKARNGVRTKGLEHKKKFQKKRKALGLWGWKPLEWGCGWNLHAFFAHTGGEMEVYGEPMTVRKMSPTSPTITATTLAVSNLGCRPTYSSNNIDPFCSISGWNSHPFPHNNRLIGVT